MQRLSARTRRGGQDRSARGVTLLEVLTVTMIIGLLIALLLPALNSTRESMRRMQCSNNLRQIGLAIHQYEQCHGQYPMPKTEDPGHNMLTFILPELGYKEVFDEFDLGANWSSTVNRSARQVEMPLFVCPSGPADRTCRDKKYYVTDYATCETIHGTVYKPMVQGGVLSDRPSWYNLFQPYTKGPSYSADVKDGLSQTFMLFECVGRPLKYVSGRRRGDPDASPKEPMSGASWADKDAEFWIHDTCGGGRMFNCTNQNEIYSFHPGGGNFLFGDGSVRFTLESIESEVFVSLFTRAGQDVP